MSSIGHLNLQLHRSQHRRFWSTAKVRRFMYFARGVPSRWADDTQWVEWREDKGAFYLMNGGVRHWAGPEEWGYVERMVKHGDWCEVHPETGERIPWAEDSNHA